MDTARERILDAAEELISRGQVPPSLEAVAAAAGVSKGGLLYHFDKRSLLTGLIVRAVRRADDRLTAAAARGTMAATGLRLSAPGEGERRLHRAMLSMLRLTSRGELDLPEEVADAERRWHRMLVDELADPARGRLVRLVGDGLFLGALVGRPPAAAEVEEIIAHLGLPAGDA
jgi:AcrR family transcriptional regulator